MLTKLEDEKLINGVINGDAEYFEELMTRYTDKVFNLAMRLTRSKEDAEEVMQDVFVTIYRKLPSFEGKSSFSSWLYRITVNAGLMKLRKRRQDRTIAMDDVITHFEKDHFGADKIVEGTDSYTLRQQLNTKLEEAIGKLPSEYRSVFVLRDVDGLTSKEVGEILDISIPAVKSRLHRARLMLRKRLLSFYREFVGDRSITLDRVGNDVV